MSEFTLSIPGHVLFGLDTANQIGRIVEAIGRRAVVVTESVMYEAEAVQRVRRTLERQSIDTIVFDELAPGAGSATVEEVASLVRASKADVVIGLGGVRVLATARCAAYVATGDVGLGALLDGAEATGGTTPYVEIPSSCRNHFMLRNEAVLTDNATMRPSVVHLPRGLVRSVVIDPRLSMSLSVKYNAAAMLDTLLGAIEGYISGAANVLSDGLLASAIEILSNAILPAYKNAGDVRPRVRAAEAGLLTALGLATSSQGIGGALSYAINSRFQVPKSWVSTVLLPHVIDRHVTVRSDKLAKVASLLNEYVDNLSRPEGAARAATAIRRLLGRVGLPSRLRDFDLTLDDLSEIAESALTLPFMQHAPLPFNESEVFDLIKAAF